MVLMCDGMCESKDNGQPQSEEGVTRERWFRDSLRELHSVVNELSTATCIDDLCRRAVELGRERLGFRRLGFWLGAAEEPLVLNGTYGTDERGRTRDERGHRIEIAEGDPAYDYFQHRERSAIFRNRDLFDSAHNIVGQGDALFVSAWDSKQLIGFFCADNLLDGKPLTERQCELLTLYGSSVGHLCSLIRTEEYLREHEAESREFELKLKALNEVGNILSMAESSDELCRRAVELGRSRLGFERLGIAFTDRANPDYLTGSYGTDERGQTRDERSQRFPIAQIHALKDADANERRCLFIKDTPLYDNLSEEVGRGDNAVACIWDGKQLSGYISADNLIRHQPITQRDCEILSLYASTIGHLHSLIRTREELREREENFRTFFNTIDDFLFVLDDSGRIIYVNDTVLERLGYTPDELRDRSIQSLHPSGRRSDCSCQFFELLSGKANTCPLPLLTKDGQSIPASTRIMPGRWQGRDVLFGVSQDISAAAVSEEKFSKAFHSNPSLMSFTTFDEGRFIDVNNALTKTLGYSRDEIIGSTSLKLGIFKNQDIRASIFKNLYKGKEVRNHEVTLYGKDGEAHTGLLSADVLQLQGQRFILTVVNDITSRKHAEDCLRRREAILEAVGFIAQEILGAKTWEDSATEALARLGKAAAADHVYIFENELLESGSHAALIRYEWAEAGIPHILQQPAERGNSYEANGFQRWADLLSRRETIAEPIYTMPESERHVLTRRGIHSIVVTPIFDGDRWWGFLGIDDNSAEREWEAAEIDALRTAAGIIGAGILRKRTDAALRERTTHLDNILRSASDLAIVTIDLDYPHYILQSNRGEILRRHIRGCLRPL